MKDTNPEKSCFVFYLKRVLVCAVILLVSATVYGNRVEFLAAVSEPGGALRDLRTRQNVDPPSIGSSEASEGGTLSWSIASDWTDEIGHRHVTYHQYLRPTPGNSQIPEDVGPVGVRLEGAALKFHYNSSGDLTMLSGALYEDVEAVGELTMPNAMAALGRAWWVLENIAGYEMSSLQSLHSDVVKKFREETTVWLRPTSVMGEFEYVWRMPFMTASGRGFAASVHGGTGELLNHWDPNPNWKHFTCGPSSPVKEAGKVVPERGDVPEKSPAYAKPTIDNPGYTHLANWPRANGPDMLGYITVPDGETSCIGPFQEYTIMPLTSDLNGGPLYSGPWKSSDPLAGNILGDAMWKTAQTMDVLAELGWDSFDNAGSIAKVVVEVPFGPKDNARFVFGIDDLSPRNAVNIAPKQWAPYTSAAALDTVAHEWGHGVAGAAGYNPFYPISRGFDEEFELAAGFADVLGHIVEWYKEPEGPLDGTVPETADWVNNEDAALNDTTKRYANMRVTPMCYYHEDVYDSGCHRNESVSQGNKLSVAFWLLADGRTNSGDNNHKNPLCEATGSYAGIDCNLEVTPIGLVNASKVFFRLLTVSLNITIGDNGASNGEEEWNALPNMAKASASYLFGYDNGPGNCSDALAIQDSIQDAFTAIGVPGNDPDFRACTFCGCGS